VVPSPALATALTPGSLRDEPQSLYGKVTAKAILWFWASLNFFASSPLKQARCLLSAIAGGGKNCLSGAPERQCALCAPRQKNGDHGGEFRYQLIFLSFPGIAQPRLKVSTSLHASCKFFVSVMPTARLAANCTHDGWQFLGV